MNENKTMTRNMKNVNFVSKDVQRILSSHNISEKYNDQEAFYIKKTVLKNFAISWENNCVGVSFLIKMQTFRSGTLLKRESSRGVLLTIFKKKF